MHQQCSNQIGQYAIVMPPIVKYWVLGSLCICMGLSEPLFVYNVMSSETSCACSKILDRNTCINNKLPNVK